jgi:hypothetical protein
VLAKSPIRHLSDFKGKKIRIFMEPGWRTEWRMGADLRFVLGLTRSRRKPARLHLVH